MLIAMIVLVSALSGCLGNNDEIDEKNNIITNLEDQILNLNQENDNLTNELDSLNENLK